jgi:hypothetical protein
MLFNILGLALLLSIGHGISNGEKCVVNAKEWDEKVGLCVVGNE